MHKNKEIKYPLKFKLSITLILIMVNIIYFTWILNNYFAQPYYEYCQKKNLVETYETIKSALSEHKTDDEILTETNKKNIHFLIIDSERQLSNITPDSEIYSDLNKFMLQVDNSIHSKEDNNLKKKIEKDEYILGAIYTGRSTGLYLFGYSNDNIIGLTIPLDSIITNANISSRLFLYVSFAGTFIGIIIFLILANQFTKPIKEISETATKMKDLDFNAKTNIHSNDELEVLGNAMNSLSETLEKTISDLKSANAQLKHDIMKKEEIDEMRKEFISHVSHELKTPIALIQGYAEGLTDGIADDREMRDYYLNVIIDEAKKMNNMVGKLLTLNQLEFGNITLDMSRFNITEMIENKIETVKVLLKEKNNTIIFNELPTDVWADEFMIEEVLTNYISNAIHHVKENGIIKIWYRELGNDIRIHVFNEGNTIPEEEMDKIWIKFYKTDKARTREYGGSGIGLSIVSAIMKLHNQEYGVKNTDNGVVFYFDINKTV